jgi:NADH-quinone oxidoreductase subunit G
MPNSITITVDGREVQVPPRFRLIEALRLYAGIETPSFCYHPELSVVGNCRICLVEIEGPRGWCLAISCNLLTEPGMKIRTQVSSPAVRRARQAVMEFQLVNHPLDCPICDKAGECVLQEHYMGQDGKESRLADAVGKAYKGGPDQRFTDTKGVSRGGKAIDLGPTIVLDQERCIVCGRCVRFMDEVAKAPQLTLAGRGDTAYLTTFPGQRLDHPYDLNTTDICPVGALTGKHFRFQQRVWFLKRVESIDPGDALGANLTIEYADGRVWRLMPRRNPAVNRSWIANRTRLLYQQLGDNRLIGGISAGKDCDAEPAFAAAATALRQAKRIALVASGHLTVEDNTALLALAAALGGHAEVFGGSWLPVDRPDGIALSGDPVANRAGCRLLGIRDNLDELAKRAGEFDCLLVVGNDMWSQDAAKARPLEAIPQRLALSSWRDATVAKATVAIGIRAWAEVRGVMVNCNGLAQLMQACPVLPAPDLLPAWRALDRLAGLAVGRPLGWASEAEVWKSAGDRVRGFAGLTYRAIGPSGAPVADQPVTAGA